LFETQTVSIWTISNKQEVRNVELTYALCPPVSKQSLCYLYIVV